jgi:hypothetical protein
MARSDGTLVCEIDYYGLPLITSQNVNLGIAYDLIGVDH